MTMINRYVTNSGSVYNIGYHLIWCTKYRRKVLIGDIEQSLKNLCLEKATEIGVSIESIEVMPDHVHIFCKSIPTYAPHYIVQQMKGYTSRVLRDTFPSLKSKLPTLWTRSYFCESVGHISQETIIKYIENQKNV